jgi:hypothetical protein
MKTEKGRGRRKGVGCCVEYVRSFSRERREERERRGKRRGNERVTSTTSLLLSLSLLFTLNRERNHKNT